jgi:two-component system, OmpR family, response regulator
MEKRILIIDDEEDICLLMKNYIQRQHALVAYALTLKEGLEMIANLQPEVIFLDNNLPDGIGLDEIERVKRLNPKARIIMISAMNHLREKALSRGADFFLEKPISFKAISKLLI